MAVSTFGDGSVLTSSALTPDSILKIFQFLAWSIFGISLNDPAAGSAVRIDWPTSGQPSWNVGDDVCFLSAREVSYEAAKTRNVYYAQNDSKSLLETITYMRVWLIGWTLYGPNGFDHARLVIDAMFLQQFHDQLAKSNLYVVPNMQRPRYAPELFQAQWWKRTDLEIEFNELVTATITIPTVASAEVIVETKRGISKDITIVA